ncbi:hypothetical protein AYI70_g2025 [Smittium culicis]|uniref:Elongator complex protein 5 n=1 Tax=Smittium culicis TaxID=133412 RepID=A0A1R1YA57_9FUNG|nr:hypothetical protein AYI70_g2025 [Smittium culicis]
MPGWFDQEYTEKFFNVKEPPSIKTANKNITPSVPILSTAENLNAKFISSGLALLELRKTGGKVSREIVQYTFSNGDLKASFPESYNEPVSESTNNDPTADIPFNLKLTDDQKQAKDSVILPYTEAQGFQIPFHFCYY